MKLVKQHLLQVSMQRFATHDEQIIHKLKEFLVEKEIKREQFEFQMLYGIREDLQKQLVDEGYKVRVYVPYGTDWFGYYIAAVIGKTSQCLVFILKNVFK